MRRTGHRLAWQARRLYSAALLPLAFMGAAHAASSPEASADSASLASVVLARLALEDQPLCAAVAVTGREEMRSTTVCRQAGEKIDTHSVFEIGSVSKAFAGILLQRLVQDGRVRLDDPLGRFVTLPKGIDSRRAANLTLRSLATHTSGLPRSPPRLSGTSAADPFAALTGASIVEALDHEIPAGPSGARFTYSHYGFMLLGLAESRASGESYEQLLSEQILTPLGLHETGLGSNATLDAHRVSGHDGALHLGRVWRVNPELSAATGMVSTLSDMALFARGNLVSELKAPPQRSRLEQAMVDSHAELFAGDGLSVGTAWLRATDQDKLIVSISGQTGGYHAFVGFSVATECAVVVLVNGDVDLDDLGLHLIDARLPTKRTHVARSLEGIDLSELTGEYRLRPGVVLSVSALKGRLFARVTGQPAIELSNEGRDQFFAGEVNAVLLFNRDRDAHVTGLTLLQNGRPADAPKVRRP
ncbi:MAG: serine hydrolase [Burkholderiaceae bacterium]